MINNQLNINIPKEVFIMRKKGSMQLGINAIVILIIALAILGLGIGFVTKLFGDSTTRFVQIIKNADLPFSADSTDQLVLETKSMDLRMKKAAQLRLSVYNDGGVEADTTIFMQGSNLAEEDPIGECLGTEGTNAEIALISPTQNINSGEAGAFSTMLKYENGDVGEYICTVTAYLDDNIDETDNIELTESIYVTIKR